ncbi:MAG: trypsin-like peptidase domain-containing protein [Planctomycetota bacterium]
MKTLTPPLGKAALAVGLIAVLAPASVAKAGDVPVSIDPAVLEAQAERAALVKRIAPTVVAIFGPAGGGGGSGVLISADGYAVTNFHVTDGCGDAMKCGLNDGKVYDAVIVGTDPVGDVALIKLLGRDDFPAAEFGDSDAVRPGDWCLAMGNPFLLAQSDFAPTVTYGLVSGTHRYQEPAGTFLEYTDCLQIDASVNPGNSGGPLFAADGPDAGKLIGINGRISIKRGRVNSGAAYAISSNQVKYFLGHLRSGRALDHGTLNATVRTNYDGDVLFDRVLPGSAAEVRGVREGDELVAFAGRPIRSTNQFKNVLGVYPAGWPLPLTIRRGTETIDLIVRTRGLNRRTDIQKTVAPKPGPPPTKAVRDLLKKRPGYANAHFNDLEKERVLASLGASANKGGWKLFGADADGTAAKFTLTDRGVGLTLGKNANNFLQTLEGDFEVLDEPPGTGGLLFALRQWQLLSSGRTDAFADLHYVGTEPLDWDGPTVDVLSAENRGVTVHFYVEQTDSGGRLRGLDAWQENRGAATEIRFEGEPVDSSLPVPTEMRVSAGDVPYRTFTFASVETSDPGENE